MSDFGSFPPQTGDLGLAITAATISILLGGILFGVGIGFGMRRLRLFGAEEIGQGIISAAMVGALAIFVAVLNAASGSIVPQDAASSCAQAEDSTSLPFSYYVCNLAGIASSSGALGSALSRSADIAGFASSLKLSAGVVSAQPFFALESASKALSGASQQAYSLSALAFFEMELAKMVSSAAFSIFLPIGLILRTFFATRKLGAAAMAISISAYLVYPLLFLYTFSVSQSSAALGQAAEATSEFNAKFASIPLLELDETSAVRDKVNEMSGGDFSSQVQPIFPLAYTAFSRTETDLMIYPILSLIVSIVAAFELYGVMSSPIVVPYFDSV